jgi:hypothetical protein
LFLGVQENDFTVVVKMPSKEFADICTQCEKMKCDSVEITIVKVSEKTDPKITFQVKEGTCTGTIHRYSNDKTKLKIAMKVDKIQQTYPIKYLCKIAKGGCLSEEVKIGLCENAPIHVEYAIDDLTNKENPPVGLMSFTLASTNTEGENADEKQ